MLNLSFMSPVLRQYTYVEIANFTVVLLGMSVVWASPMVIKLRDEEQTVLSRPITEDEAAWIVSISLLSGLAVPTFSGVLMDKLGRKTALLCSYIPRFLFCFLAIFASDYWMVMLARAFAGVADIMCLSAISTYSSEVANKEIRGQSGTMTQINSAVGMMIMFAVGPFVSYMAMNILMTCLVAASFIPLLFLPESPFFFYSKGETGKSIEVLTLLHGSEELAHEELKAYSTSNNDTDEVISKWVHFKDRVVLKTFLMVFLLALSLQLIGYNAVNLYLQTIFESANTTVSSEISSLIIGVIQLIACSCTFFLTNRFARKQILCTSLVGLLIGMLGLGTFFTIMENGTEISGFLNFLPLISAAIAIYGFNAGMGSLFWMLLAELLYGPVRAYGISMAMFVTTLTAFCITLFFPAMTRSIGASGTYWIFAAFCAITIIFIAVFVPETKGKSFAEIQIALGKKDNTAKDQKDDIKAHI